jgi:hypothetical protein
MQQLLCSLTAVAAQLYGSTAVWSSLTVAAVVM